MNRIKKGDQVIVIAGKDKGKRVRWCVWPATRWSCPNVNIIKRHTKPNPQAGQPAAMIEREAPIHISNVDAVQPGFGQGRARRFQGARGWTQSACVPLER